MAILNFSTTVSVERSMEAIHTLLRRHGASAILFDYDPSRQIHAISFKMLIDGAEVAYRLPANWPGALAAMRADPKVPRRFCTEAHARRVAWRIVKNWVEVQLAFVEARQASLAQIMLPYAMTETGQTVYERWSSQRALPPAPSGE